MDEHKCFFLCRQGLYDIGYVEATFKTEQNHTLAKKQVQLRA